MLTVPLKKAFEKAGHLPPEKQKALAEVVSRVQQELTDESRWEKSFAESQEGLSKLAEEAILEYQSGQTTPMDEGS